MSRNFPSHHVPVSSKAGILTVSILTTLSVFIAVLAIFVLPFMKDIQGPHTYFDVIGILPELKVDAYIIGGGLGVSLLAAWLIYFMPRSGFATVLRMLFTLGAAAAAVIAVLTIYVAGPSKDYSFMEYFESHPALGWGIGAWILAGICIFVFCLSVVMWVAVAAHRRYVKKHLSKGGYSPNPGGYGNNYPQNPYVSY